ncbi:interferon kappa-like [Platysternon megacephalum]|uniref:Aromatic amino acid aminotransferase n=1 Tax=Platysternon megacephalum TaxID=55544 RepID=A0A4D9F523_9SAUR|nr:aromatic amino acid aminotransferase [Platysternon megacephalum]TFK15463.1 interferon kappa-like [Platysternon megacephalum]
MDYLFTTGFLFLIVFKEFLCLLTYSGILLPFYYKINSCNKKVSAGGKITSLHLLFCTTPTIYAHFFIPTVILFILFCHHIIPIAIILIFDLIYLHQTINLQSIYDNDSCISNKYESF